MHDQSSEAKGRTNEAERLRQLGARAERFSFVACCFPSSLRAKPGQAALTRGSGRAKR